MSNAIDMPLKKTLCILSVSHYHNDLLEGWCRRWADQIKREPATIQDDNIPAVLEFWTVTGPGKAFAELPSEVFASNYRALLGDVAID
jgi:hypothetical protein